MLFIVLGILLNLPNHDASVALNIDGLIDLGPKWNYEYKVITVPRSVDEASDNSDESNEPYFRNSDITFMKTPEKTQTFDTQYNIFDKTDTETQHALVFNGDEQQPRASKKRLFRKHKSEKHVSEEEENDKKHNRTTSVEDGITKATKKIWKKKLRTHPTTKYTEPTTTVTKKKRKKKLFRKTTKAETPETTTESTTRKRTKTTTHKSKDHSLEEDKNEKKIIKELKKLITMKVTMLDTVIDDILNESSTEVTPKMKKQHSTADDPDSEVKNTEESPEKIDKNIQRQRKTKHKGKHAEKTKKRNKTKKNKNKDKTERFSTNHDSNEEEDIFDTPHKVSEDANLKKMFLYIFGKASNYLKDVKKMLHNTDKLDGIVSTYKRKFKEFVKETQKSNIKTIFGSKKVILNTLEMSSYYLDKLINFLIVKIEEKGVVYGKAEELETSLRNSLNEELDEEYKYVCSTFGACRDRYNILNFLVDFIEEQLQCDDSKMKISTGSLTEALKSTPFSFMEGEDNSKLTGVLDWIDSTNPSMLRSLWAIMKNTFANSNKPLTLNGISQMKAKQSIAFMDIMTIISENIPANDKNIALWNDLITGTKTYAEGKRKDIQAIMNTLVTHLVTYSKTFSEDVINSIKDRLNVALL